MDIAGSFDLADFRKRGSGTSEAYAFGRARRQSYRPGQADDGGEGPNPSRPGSGGLRRPRERSAPKPARQTGVRITPGVRGGITRRDATLSTTNKLKRRRP